MSKFAELFDGTRLEFPDDTSDSVIEKVAKQETLARQKQEPKEESGLLRQAADIPVGVAKGFTQGIRMIADAFGADNSVSKTIRGAEDYLGDLMSAQAKNDQKKVAQIMKDAEDKGVADQVIAGLKAFTVAPVDLLSQALGTAGPAIVAALAVSNPIGAAATAVGVGATMGAGTLKGSIYDSVKEALADKMPPDQVEARAVLAQEYGGKNLDQILSGAAIGGLSSLTGITPRLIPSMAKNIMEKAATKSTTGKAIAAVAGEAIPEAVQGGQEQLAQNIALQREGIDTPTFRGVAGAATMEGVAGGVLGGGVHMLGRSPAAPQQELSELPSLPTAPVELTEAPAEMQGVSPVPITQPRYMPLNADEARQQSYEQQVAQQNATVAKAQAASVGTPYTGPVDATGKPAPVPKDRFGNEIVTPPADPFAGYNTQPLRDTVSKDDRLNDPNRPAPPAPAARVPITEERRIAAQQLAQQQNDEFAAQQERALRQTQNPSLNPEGFGAGQAAAPRVTPAESQLRQSGETVTPAQARRIDRQSKLLGQMDGLPQVEQEGLNAQADIAAGTGKPGGPNYKAPPETRFVALEAMTPREARQRLAALKEELKTEDMPAELAQFRKQGLQGPQPKGLREPNRSLHVVPHPTVGGRYAIEERVKQPDPEPKQPRRADPNTPLLEQAVGMIREVQNTGVVTPTLAALANQYKLNFILDDNLKRFKQKQTAPDIISQQRQGMADESALNAEMRGGVATQAEADRLNAQGMGQPYDKIEQTGPDSRELGLSERERRLNAEDAAARLAADTDPVAIARRRFHEKLQGPELWLEGFDVNPNAEPAPASQEFTDKFLKPEGRFSLTATPAMKAVLADPKPLLAMLKRFGLGKVGLRLVDSIRNGTAEGQYAQQLITLAMDNKDPMGVLRHEAIHALKELGAFTDAEWKILTKAAKDKWINQFYNRDMQGKYQEAYLEAYGNLDGFPEYMQEEAIAQAFRFYTETKPPSGMIANLMRRLDNFFESLRNFFEGKGFQNVDEMFLPNRILADIESGNIKPGRAPLTPEGWKATPEEKRQAKEYERENGIDPYLSDGQLKVDVPQARFSLKPSYTDKQVEAGKGDNHPIFGVPVNKNGTITLYLPTNNAEARRVIRDRKLKGNTPEANRIYLTNESDGAKVMKNRGNIDHSMDGANVMVHINPEFLQLDQEFADGRKDFFIQIAEGEAFANKMAMTKLFTLNAPRDQAISKETTLGEIREKLKTGVETFAAMNAADKRVRLAQAKEVLKTQHNVGTLLSENGKLQKTRVGDYGLKFDGNSVASMGLGLASAQKITEKLSTCPQAARCEGLCLGDTSGQNLLYGGQGQFKSGPRLSQYLKTEAMVINPEDFAIVLYNEIQKFNAWANKESGTETITNDDGEKVKVPKQVYQPAIRLNVTSDFAPNVFDPIINAFPATEFYDYTKLNTKTIAPNHHLTYSSTGVAQVVDGKTVGIGSNWNEMVKKLNDGKNVAMAFTSRKSMPDFVVDEATGKTYQVWNGDNYDARFLDPKPNEKGNKLNQGMIVGLTNKDRTGRPEDSAIKHDGFFVDYDPSRDGKTLTIKDQSKFSKATPIMFTSKPKFSLKAPDTTEFKRWFGDSKVVGKDGKPEVVYHSTYGDFADFTTNFGDNEYFQFGVHVGTQQSAENRLDLKKAEDQARGVRVANSGANIMPLYASIKNPLRLNENRSGRWGVDDIMSAIMNKADKTGIANITNDDIENYFNDTFDMDTWLGLRADVGEANYDPSAQERFWTDVNDFSSGERSNLLKDFLKQLGYDGIVYKNEFEGGGDSYIALDSYQVKSAFNQSPTKASRDVRFSLRQQSTPAFKQWFGNSKITNPDGTARVMYHGSANDISEFIGVKAGAVFVTADPTIAAGYTELSEEYKIEQMLDELQTRYEAMPLIERQQLIKTALKKGVKQKAISQNGAKEMLQDMADSGFDAQSLSQVQEFIIPDLKDKLESRANVMPLYVRAENTFDFENPNHIKEVSNEVNRLATGDTDQLLRSLATGFWEAVESDLVQQAVKNLGFDSFFIKELGQKNLAVYNANQVKSAIGNTGEFSRDKKDIRYSLAPLTKLTAADPNNGQAIINAAKTGASFLTEADKRTSVRGKFVDKYSRLRQLLSSIDIGGNDETKGILRADQLKNAQAQSVNLIKGGLNTGVPVLNDDGTIIIQRSEDNLARSAQLADKLDSNAHVAQSGYSGRQFVAEIARIRRGQDILAEDADIRAEAARNMLEADRLEADLRAKAKRGRSDPQSIANAQNKINAMRKQADEDSKINREKEVKPEHIAWADAQMKAVPEVQEIFDIWKNVNTALVNLYEATGVISKATADKYRSNKNYVPLFKSQEDMNQDGSMGFIGGGVKRPPKLFKLEGAEMRRNIWENVQKQYAAMIAASYENQTRREAVRQLKLVSADGIKTIDPAEGGANLLYREGGQDVYVRVDDPNLLMAFQSLPFEINPVIQFFGGFSKVLRAGALLNPMFWLKQLIRDPISATITGGHIVTPIHSAAEFMRVILGNSEEARILASRGVIGQFDSTLSIEEYIDSLGKEKRKPSSASKLLTKFLEIHEASDAATRIAIFKKAKAKALRDGKSESQAVDYAVHQAREAINFAITGSSPTIAALRQLIPFMNATIVGLDTLYRAASGYGLNPEEKAKAQRMFATRAFTLVAMSFAYAMMFQDDDEYKKQPDYVKDGNWLFPVTIDGQRTFVKIPVPYEIGFLFKALPEMMVRYMAGTSSGKEVLASFRGGLIQNLPTGGNPIPQAIKPLAEVITNHSFFTNSPLEGMGDQRLPVAQRGEKASEFAKMMSKFGLDEIGLSPVKIDALTKGYFAEFGAFFNELIDFTIAQASGKEKPSRNFENLPVLKSFLADPNVSKAVGDFYKIEHDAEEVSNLFAKYKNQGNVEGINEIVGDKERLNQMAASKPLGKIQMQMAKIKNAMKVIENDQSIPAAERRKQLNELQAVFNDLGKLGANIGAQLNLPSAPTPYR
jgi:hypothetical protein